MNIPVDQKAVADAIGRVVGNAKRPVALHEPTLGAAETDLLAQCIKSGWVSSSGEFITRFEREIADFVGVPHAVATVNGTAALHICLLVIGVAPDDEVLIPSLTFVATANAVRYCHAVPHFVDCETESLGPDPERLRKYLVEIAVRRDGNCVNRATGRVIRAIVPMHVFGHPVTFDPLLEVAAEFGIAVVEDAAESLGSTYKGRQTGGLARIGALSFNGNKIITTGGGGMIVTADDDLGSRARHLATTAKRPHRWAFDHDMVGYNYRMPNLNAALGVAQLARLVEFLAAKRGLAERYIRAFEGIAGVRIFAEPSHGRSNYWLNALLLDRPDIAARDSLLNYLSGVGFGVRPTWTPMHRLPMFAGMPQMDLRVTDEIHARTINLPSSPFLFS